MSDRVHNFCAGPCTLPLPVLEEARDEFVDYHGADKRQPRSPLSFTQTTPSRAAQRIEATERVQLAIRELTEDHRTVLQLRRVEERGLAEVAEIMGRSVPATKMLYWRAVEALGRVLERFDQNPHYPGGSDPLGSV